MSGPGSRVRRPDSGYQVSSVEPSTPLRTPPSVRSKRAVNGSSSPSAVTRAWELGSGRANDTRVLRSPSPRPPDMTSLSTTTSASVIVPTTGSGGSGGSAEAVPVSLSTTVSESVIVPVTPGIAKAALISGGFELCSEPNAMRRPACAPVPPPPAPPVGRIRSNMSLPLAQPACATISLMTAATS